MEGGGGAIGGAGAGNAGRRGRPRDGNAERNNDRNFPEIFHEVGVELMMFSTTMIMINSLQMTYEQLGGVVVYGRPGEIMVNVILIRCIMPAVAWSFRRYGCWPPALFALFLSLYLHYFR